MYVLFIVFSIVNYYKIYYEFLKFMVYIYRIILYLELFIIYIFIVIYSFLLELINIVE